MCSLTQEVGVVWAAGNLFQATHLGDGWVPIPGGQGVERMEQRMGLGVSLLDPVLLPTAPCFEQRSQLRIELCGCVTRMESQEPGGLRSGREGSWALDRQTGDGPG